MLKLLDCTRREQNCLKDLDDIINKLSKTSGSTLELKNFLCKVKEDIK